MKATVCLPPELGRKELEFWRQFQAEQELLTPFLSPEYARAVGEVDAKARVGVLFDGQDVDGFLAFKRGAARAASAIGQGHCDAQSFLLRRDLEWDLAGVIRACGLDHWEFDHLLGSQVKDGPSVVRVPSLTVDTSQAYESYVKRRRGRSSKFGRVLEQKQQRLRRDHADLSFEFGGNSLEALSQLLRWKSDQYRRTGRRDPFRRAGFRDLIEILAATNTPSLTGSVSVLSIGARPIAVDFSHTSHSVFAGRLTSYDTNMASNSPGSVHLLHVIEAACSSSIRYIDFGRGDEGYKGRMATGSIEVAEGYIGHASLGSFITRARYVPVAFGRQTILTHPRLRAAVRSGLHAVGRLRGKR
jgi:CelD/BcsL family acetyltransferase involved in cellulose biosynthesis